MLYIIGLGLSWKDISLRALEAINQCNEVYLEHYTSISDFTIEQLKRLIGKKIINLDRKQAEGLLFLKEAHTKDVALLVYGDALSATTHFEILEQAKKKKIETKLIHSSSILTAIAETGLSLYRFGKTASIPIPEKNFQPKSFIEILKDNQKIDAHTLFLLDLKPDQDKYLTIPEAIKILLSIKDKIFTENTFCVACARLGSENSLIKTGKAKDLMKIKFDNPPYCLIIPAKLNHKEEEYIRKFK